MLNKLKVGQRLLLIVGIALIVAVVQGSIGLIGLSNSKNSLKSVYEDRMVPVGKLNEIAKDVLKTRTHINAVLAEATVTIGDDKKPNFVISKENAGKEVEYLDKKIKDINSMWTEYQAGGLSSEERVLADKFAASLQQYLTQIVSPAIEQLKINSHEGLSGLNNASRDLFNAADKDMVELQKLQQTSVATLYQDTVSQNDSIRQITLAILAAALLLLIGLGLAITRSITWALGGEPGEIYDTAKRIAAGDLDFNVPLAADDRSSAMAAMSNMQANIKLLVADTVKLSQAALQGNLATRADANQHQGDFRKVVNGVNATLDAVIGPLNVAANYVDRISKGDIPAKITDNYNGDFNTLKSNLNTCIDAINNMVAEAVHLEEAAIEGHLHTRADVSKYQGDYRKVIDGVNKCLDAVIGPLNVAADYVEHFAKGDIPAKITDSYNGEFNTIKNNLNACIDALSLLVSDASMLAQAAQSNRLDARADVTRHWGDYRKVVEGVNGTLDTVMQKNAADAAIKAQEAQLLSDAVEETQAIIESAKAGDLSNRVPLDGKDGAIASLCDGINALLDKMTEVIIQVRDAGEAINTAAGEISSGNSDLSSRTEQQASSLEETAASMEELASTVKNNADNAKQANQLATAASGVAVKGGTVVGQAVETMNAINESARKIEDIISVIDGIAFQTNILALNAAVEAARAGEQGRGFAVVAGEVRNLAQRSASAAKEIKELIHDSVSKTAEGTEQVENAGKTMLEIVSSVQRVTDIMGEITAASVEQSVGIDQVNHAITSMDEVTQQNAALVEQAAAAAESLVDQAVGLMDTVRAFKLAGSLQNTRQLRTIQAPAQLRGSAPLKAIASKGDDFSFAEAKQAHIKWKNRLIDYIAGRSTEHLEVEKVCRDDLCPLGGWIYGHAQQYSRMTAFNELKTAHAEFHASVGHIVRCVHDQNQAEAKLLLGGEFSKTSKRTITAINDIEAKVS